ncbi:MAG: Ig-like domain-containing protein, partial [Candidatus Gracilibacteria bacterium]|nr:Ig-like domain-containing protein [Candidatus Gracilibacteria bacterium]
MCLHQANAESGPIHINTNDTVAGYSTSFKTSKINPEREIIFRVKKPDNSIVEIPATTDELGYADANFLGFHTKKAGIYQVLAFYKDENFENAPKTAFSVYAGEVSEVSSKITSEPPSLEANNKDTSLLKISLKDTYSNPVSNHNVLVISSRPDDIIQNVSESSGTDEKGVSYFHLSSKKAGISYITVIDQTTNKVLEDREKIIFFEPEIEKPMGGNLYQANMFATSSSSDDSNSQPTNFSADEELFGPIDHFDIDFPNKVKVGSDQNNLKITAKDKQGRIVKSYTGTIIISTPDDENATLPGDGKYTFQPRDQGERTFDLALIFAKSGRQAIEVYDFDADEGV